MKERYRGLNKMPFNESKLNLFNKNNSLYKERSKLIVINSNIPERPSEDKTRTNSNNCISKYKSKLFDPDDLELENHYNCGIPQKIHKDSLISIIFPKIKKYSRYFSFPENDHINNIRKDNFIKYDFPKYDKTSFQGYSMFQTFYEKNEILKRNINETRNNENSSGHDPYKIVTPVLKKNYVYCMICKEKVTSFENHFISPHHYHSCQKEKINYERIEHQLQLIRKQMNYFPSSLSKNQYNKQLSITNFEFNFEKCENIKPIKDIYFYLMKKRKKDSIFEKKRRLRKTLIKLGIKKIIKKENPIHEENFIIKPLDEDSSN